MIPKRLDAITFADISALIANQVAESRTLEFKRSAIGSRDEDKREFLADISAFANSSGGDIIFGIEQIDGIAKNTCPIALTNTDDEQLKLDSILRSGLDPKIPQYDFQWIQADPGYYFLVIRVPRSWAMPHRVTFRDHSKFYARSSAGKYAMDVMELRAAFNGAQTLASQIKQFRADRALAIEKNEGALPLIEGAKLIFHILPISAFTNPVTVPSDERVLFSPLGSGSGFNTLHTLEGFSTYSGREDAGQCRSYTLLFRNGIVESVAMVGHSDDKGNLIIPESIERSILERWSQYFKNLGKVGVTPPFYVTMSLMGVRGHSLYSGDRYSFRSTRRDLNRENLIFPELFLDEELPNYLTAPRPLFDLMWQAFGYEQSFSFNQNGEYVGQR